MPATVFNIASGGDELLAHEVSQPYYEDIELPAYHEASNTMPPLEPLVPQELTCEWVIPTGSKMRKKVCNKPSAINRKREADQKIFDDIKRNTAIGNSQL